MTNNIKLPLAFIALACALPLAAPAIAQDDVLVVSQSALQQWQEDRTKELGRLLQDDRGRFGRPLAGIVQISFSLDGNGRPTNLQTVHNSAGIASQRVAHWAVGKMRNLGDVPATGSGEIRFQANVIFADDVRERDAFAADLAAMEEVRMAAAQPGTAAIAIG